MQTGEGLSRGLVPDSPDYHTELPSAGLHVTQTQSVPLNPSESRTAGVHAVHVCTLRKAQGRRGTTWGLLSLTPGSALTLAPALCQGHKSETCLTALMSLSLAVMQGTARHGLPLPSGHPQAHSSAECPRFCPSSVSFVLTVQGPWLWGLLLLNP